MKTSPEKPGYRIYYDVMKSLVNAVIFVEADKYEKEYLNVFCQNMKLEMEKRNFSVHFFTVLCVNSEEDLNGWSIAKQVCAEDPFSWIYDEKEEKPVIFETSAEEFYGLRALLEKKVVMAESSEELELAFAREPLKDRIKEFFEEAPKVSLALVIINILVYIVCTFTGNLLYNKGGVGFKLVQEPSQWYRIITSMFLHIDLVHIYSNMILLYFVGEVVEAQLKPVRFLLVYLITGIFGTFATFLSEIISGEYVVVIGASGAVFGILGVLLSLVFFKRVRRETMGLGRVLFVIFVSLYEGFTAINVANWSHLGGVVSGVMIGAIYCLGTSEKNGEKEKIHED